MTTYKAIQHQEVGAGGAASITFSDIPQTYTDLVLVVSARATAASAIYATVLSVNGQSVSGRRLIGENGTVYSQTNALGYMAGAGATANTFGSETYYFPNYTTAAAHSYGLDAVTENNATLAGQGIIAGITSSTAAITSISIASDTGDLAQYSSATLYGIRRYNTSLSPKATGGAISYVDGYWIHSFTASGTFTPTENLSNVQYLVVAGGGGGGGADTTVTSSGGSGGGAGGYRSSVVGESSGGGASAESTLSLTSGTGYIVTIGAGGAGGGTAYVGGSGGTDSVFSTITSTGGGGGDSGRGTSGHNGSNGGSGGGGSLTSTSDPWPGTANQGYAGNRGSYGGSTAGAGGGGAASVGGEGTTSAAGTGGSGVASSITGISTYRAAGGGGGNSDIVSSGGAGGSSIGGYGGGSSSGPTTGRANTGSGGGGAKASSGAQSGAAGASGIVIVRYSA